MTRPIRKAAAPARFRTPRPPPVRRAMADDGLARSALLAREIPAGGRGKEPVHAVPRWPLASAMLVH